MLRDHLGDRPFNDAYRDYLGNQYKTFNDTEWQPRLPRPVDLIRVRT